MMLGIKDALHMLRAMAAIVTLVFVCAGPSWAQGTNLTTIRFTSSSSDDLRPILYAQRRRRRAVGYRRRGGHR
jgi:hypothetical protein